MRPTHRGLVVRTADSLPDHALRAAIMDYFCACSYCGFACLIESDFFTFPEPRERRYASCPQCGVNMEKVRPAVQADFLLPLITRSGCLGTRSFIRSEIDQNGSADESALRGDKPSPPDRRSATTISTSADVPGNSPDLDEILFVPQVAQWLKMDEAKVRRLTHEGMIPAFKVGKEWRFRRKDIEAWLDNQSGPIPPPASRRFPINDNSSRKACKQTPALPADCSPAALRKAIKKMGR